MERRMIFLTLLIPGLLFLNPHAVTGASLQKQMQEAENAIESENYVAALEKLESVLRMEMNKSDLARANFLMGRALYEKAFKKVNAGRPDGKVKMGDISAPEVQELKRSVSYFEAAIDALPDGILASDAYFMLGKLFDYDCLQHFKESRDYYVKAYELDPDTDTGVNAKECIDRIDQYRAHHPK